MTLSSDNPWLELPPKAPFIAACDIAALGDRTSHLHFEIKPMPYLGNIQKATVVVLALNPGFVPEDLTGYNEPTFMKLHELSFTQEADPPFYAIDSRHASSGTYIWWHRILGSLSKAGVSEEQMSQHLMCVQYFPYHSVTYTNISPVLPSQHYSFDLVRQAMAQQKIIVIMRSSRLWYTAIPELPDYPCLIVKNPRNPTLSPANLGQDNFELVHNALLQS